MSKNKNNNRPVKDNRGPKPVKKNKQTENSSRKSKQKKQSVSGFSTLYQVAGVPKKRHYNSSIPVPESKSVEEPVGLICPICSEPINEIASALTDPEGRYVHFDCVLSSIRGKEEIAENQTVSYIGSGSFAVCEKDENGKYTIIKRISYESAEAHHRLVDFVEGLKK